LFLEPAAQLLLHRFADAALGPMPRLQHAFHLAARLVARRKENVTRSGQRCGDARADVTLHSIRGLATLIFQHWPLFYYKVIALK
jgi:hypothetical protein